MSIRNSESSPTSLFFSNIAADFRFRRDIIEHRLLPEYGAVLVAQGGAIAPDSVVFADHEEVVRFQERVGWECGELGNYNLQLQKPAMAALLQAARQAQKAGLSITPRGSDSARRSYQDTEALWASRVDPALDHWVNAGSLDPGTAAEIRELSAFEQVPRILELESEGLWFAKDLSKSIIYSVAPPGTSQHLSMLAFDVAEYGKPEVRQILADHRWFQTVVSDLPHFTYLGVEEDQLPTLGLKSVTLGEQTFWVPDI